MLEIFLCLGPDSAELLDLFAVQQDVQPHQVRLHVSGIFVIEAGVP